MSEENLFPFKSYQEDPSTHVVSDGVGNEIILPKNGSLTWIEEDLLNTYILNAEKDKDGQKLPMSAAESEVVSQLLQLRYGKKPSEFLPKEEVLVMPSKGGKSKRPMSSLLVHAIYEYFTIYEKSGWKERKPEVPPSPEQQAEIDANKVETGTTNKAEKK